MMEERESCPLAKSRQQKKLILVLINSIYRGEFYEGVLESLPCKKKSKLGLSKFFLLI